MTTPTNVSLDNWRQPLRGYQQAAVNDALRHANKVLDLPDSAPDRECRILYSSPTGTGKGTMQLATLRALRDADWNAWIYTPSLDVLRGYLERCGAAPETLECGAEKLAEMGEKIFVTTPVRARNRIAEGAYEPPEAVLYDEVHHATEGNDVSGLLFAVAPRAAWIGWTATPYRGTPRGTQDLLEAWPEQVEVLSVPDAIGGGYWALPTFRVVGLVDDDTITLANGEFQTKAANKLLSSRVAAIAALARDCLAADGRTNTTGYPALETPGGWKPTAVTVPSREIAGLLVEELDRLGVHATMVHAGTKPRDRSVAYAAAKIGRTVLVSVRVLAEGVDFPWLRRLIDARPTMSPVSWVQMLGRITRPETPDALDARRERGARWDGRPEYICVCRNLERHAYLLGGAVPRQALAAAQAEFEKPSKRAQSRSIGLEALQRFKTIPLPLSGGVRGGMNIVYQVDQETGAVTEWAVLLDPTSERAVVAKRTNSARDASGARNWGKWQPAELPPDLTGFATSQLRGKLTEKQAKWWETSAARYGLDPRADVTQRVFASLPILRDLRTTMLGAAVA